MKRACALILVCATSLVAACRRDVRDRAVEPACVFLISLDTVRSDHLPVYGYARGSTPAIDALRRDSILFANAFSNVPQTLPSHATILTGLLPQNHGVRDNVGYAVSPQTPTVASILRASGWQTGAAVSAYVLRASTGIARGFNFYDDHLEKGKIAAGGAADRDGDLTRKALELWMQSAGANSRMFAFLHLYDAHAPYVPPPAFSKAATPYDGEISYDDAIVGRFLDTLRRSGLYDRSMIILLSDHGEGLGEHGEDEHGVFVYRYALQVPLLVKLPHGERHGEVVTQPVALTDVAPTILQFAGVTSNPADGTSLLRRLDKSRTIYAESWYPRLHLGWSELTSAISAQAHYIRAPHPELYAWPSDRGEVHNVIADERRAASSMSAFVDRVSRPLQPPSAVDPEDQKKLAALGYVGSMAGSGPLPDAKDRIGELHQFKLALEQFTRRDDESCRRTLRALLASDPGFVDAYGLLAQSERRSGDDRAAVSLLKTAMARFPADPHVSLALADALWATGDRQGAREHARLAMRSEPVLGHEMLATFAYRDGKLAEARTEIDSSLSSAPNRIPSLLLAATIADRNGNYAREESMLQRVVDLSGATEASVPPGVHKQLGDVLLRLRRVPEAEASFRAATVDDLSDAEAWTKLAIVLAAEGRRADAEQTLRTFVAGRPGAAARALAADAAQTFGDAALSRELRAAR